MAQRLFTNDCEYCELLSKAVQDHATVVAIKLERPALDAARAVLEREGGHSFAFGEHWNFVPVEDEGRGDRLEP